MSNHAAYILSKAGVSEPVARSLASRIPLRSYEAHDVIWAKGGEVQSWQFIITGLVAAAAPTEHARSVPITMYGSGSSRAVFSEYVQPLATDGWPSISYGQIELLSIATWRRFSRSCREQSTTRTNPTMAQLLGDLHRASIV